jgi:hypothetical protein
MLWVSLRWFCIKSLILALWTCSFPQFVFLEGNLRFSEIDLKDSIFWGVFVSSSLPMILWGCDSNLVSIGVYLLVFRFFYCMVALCKNECRSFLYFGCLRPVGGHISMHFLVLFAKCHILSGACCYNLCYLKPLLVVRGVVL